MKIPTIDDLLNSYIKDHMNKKCEDLTEEENNRYIKIIQKFRKEKLEKINNNYPND